MGKLRKRVRSEDDILYHEYEDHSLQYARRSPFTDITNGEFNWFLISSHVLSCRQTYSYADRHCDYAVPSSSLQIRHLKKRSDVAPLKGNRFHIDQSSSMQMFDITPLMIKAKGEFSNSFMINLYNCRTIENLLSLTYN